MPRINDGNRLALAMSVGMVISSNIAGGVLLGYLLDRWLGTEPWLIVTCLIIGTIGAFIGVYRIVSRLN
jgi:ATP synthase protein I